MLAEIRFTKNPAQTGITFESQLLGFECVSPDLVLHRGSALTVVEEP